VSSEFDDTWVRAFEEFAASHPIPTPPPIVKQRLRQAFERHHGRAVPPLRQTAELIFDSREHALLAGVRGRADTGERYQRTFASESHGILLDIEPEGQGGTARLEGQVLGVESAATVWAVEVHFDASSTSSIDGDENGCFQISNVPSNTHLLRLSNGELTIDISNPLGDAEE
jgi:hypothetical protein